MPPHLASGLWETIKIQIIKQTCHSCENSFSKAFSTAYKTFCSTLSHKHLLRASLLYTLLGNVNRKIRRQFCPWVHCGSQSWGLKHVHSWDSRQVLWQCMCTKFSEVGFVVALCVCLPPPIPRRRPGFVNFCFWDFDVANSRNSPRQWALHLYTN